MSIRGNSSLNIKFTQIVSFNIFRIIEGTARLTQARVEAKRLQ